MRYSSLWFSLSAYFLTSRSSHWHIARGRKHTLRSLLWQASENCEFSSIKMPAKAWFSTQYKPFYTLLPCKPSVRSMRRITATPRTVQFSIARRWSRIQCRGRRSWRCRHVAVTVSDHYLSAASNSRIQMARIFCLDILHAAPNRTGVSRKS